MCTIARTCRIKKLLDDTYMMITPPKHSYNLDLGCFSTVNSPLFTSIDLTGSTISDSVPASHCTRPSSVPSTVTANGHRDTIGFLSTRIASPLSSDPTQSPTSLDYNKDTLSTSTTTYSLATPPASCGQQTGEFYRVRLVFISWNLPTVV